MNTKVNSVTQNARNARKRVVEDGINYYAEASNASG